ncbi:histidine phosphatase family protein [Pseudomonas sp. EL_65y_Pfl2_R95]|uniref:histidine phosphatase family protein n=1 Tax=Pseudomonas sp. EL_65y_Pfl2_R95 TaxID=3088698 RepID=UPI0030DDABC7
MGKIYLIRHGQASFGTDDYDVLSPIGIRQAEIVGAHLGAQGIELDRCFSGSLRRQRHTATSAMEALSKCGLAAPPLQIEPAFNEFDAEAVIRALVPDILSEEPAALDILRNGKLQRNEFQRLFALLMGRWISGEHDRPELQSWLSFVGLVEQGLNRVLENAHNKENIAVFTSGGTITALLQLITGIRPDKAFELNWQIVNTSLSCLKFRGKQVSLASFNSNVHLTLEKAPELITYR